MEKEEFEKIVRDTRKVANDESGVVINTKKNGVFSSDKRVVTKQCEIETTESGRIVEEQLKQSMEGFLKELENGGYS